MEPYLQFEREWADFIGFEPEQVVACSSGTAALHLALESLRLPPHSEVITGDFNMIAVPRAIAMAGLVPVFVDCGEDLLMDGELVDSVVTANSVGALMYVHIYGRRCNIPDGWGFDVPYIIEDLAEAHGVRPHPMTDAACWSFYRNKIIAGEEGGAVAFRDPEHAALARQLRSLGFTAKHNFMHVPRGCNYRMSNAHAELILKSLHAYPENLKRRREVEAWYDEECPGEWRMPPRDAPWVYDLKIPGMTGEQQDELIERLHVAGIQARHWFRPMHEQPEFVNCKVVGSGHAARLSRSGIYLPIHPGVTREQVRRSFGVIRSLTPV